MKTLTTLSFLLFLLTACGGKKAQTSFSLNAGALFSGSTPAGGAVIVGKSGANKFSAGLTAAQVATFSIDLPQGDWQFYAVAWLDDSAEGPMSGKARCGISQAQVQGNNVSIDLTLTNETCALETFGPASTRDTVSYAGETTFKKVYLNSCNNPIGYPGLCDSSSIEAIPGESVSLKFVLPGHSNFGVTPPSLGSSCINPVTHDQGLFYTNVRLPLANNLGPIPVVLQGYEKLNCVDPDATYSFSGDIPGLNAVDRSITANATTSYTLTFADNYIGKTGSPFIDAQNNGKIKLPVITCGGTCYSTTNNSIDYSFAKDEVREGIWSLFGTGNQKESNNYLPSSEAFYVMVNGTGGQVTINTVSSLGSKGNNILLNVSSGGPSGDTVSVTCNSTLKTIDIVATDDVTPATVLTAINANCAGFLTATIVNPSNGGLFNAITANFTGGADSFNNQGRRAEGSVTDIKHILFGAIGAVLYANNIQTWTQLCSANGSYSYQLPNDSIIISLSSPSASALHPLFSANTAANFERKLVVNINGQNEEALFFNCLDGAGNEDHAVGTYISYKNDSRLEHVQTSWDLTNANAEWVERAIQQTESGNTMWRYDLFKGSGVGGDNWSYWSMSASTQYASYRRVAGSSAAGSIYASSFDTFTPTSAVALFSSGSQTEWSLSSGNYLSSGNNTTLEPSSIYASMTNPRTYPSFSMNDMVYNATFWIFSY